MKKDVILPIYLRKGITPLKSGYPKRPKLLVFDTETESSTTGDPYLLTFYDGEKPQYIKVTRETVLTEFMGYLVEKCRKRDITILFAHNLEFDLGAVLCDRQNEVFQYRKPPLIDVLRNGEYLGTINLYPQKTWFATIELINRARVKVVDSANFIRGSLYNISRELGLPIKKSTRPSLVTEGRSPLDRSEWNSLRLYCNREIKAQYELARYILDIHRKYDVKYSVSIANLSQHIFRKHFLECEIPQIPEHIRQLAEFCIHGGRAECFVGTPTVIPDVRMYDYNSFYPWAMTLLPPMTEGEWIHVDHFADGFEGFYVVSGQISDCRWPVVLKSAEGFRYAHDEYVTDLPICSYELREALRCGEIVIDEIDGWIWIPSKDSVNPFKNYVEHFYQLKEEHRDEYSQHLQYKLLLNSLYGKTYQALRVTDFVEEPELVWDSDRKKAKRNYIKYRAGGLYLPHIGAWITSLCRTKLHEDMHRYEALDCATDSFKTLLEVQTGFDLGGLKLEAKGLLLIVRPKLYVMFSPESQTKIEECGSLRDYLNSIDIKDLHYPRDIVKYALHGFWGNVHDLLRLYRDVETEYLCKHMNRIRESLRQNKTPRQMETLKRRVKVRWEDEVGFCGLKKGVASNTLELCSDQCFNCPYL